MGPPMDGVLAYLDETCRKYGLASLSAQVREVSAYAGEADRIDVVVLGRFKAGKSSLLNALLQREILPVDVLPATAVVTRITPGRQDGAIVRFADGASLEVPLGRLSEYVTERENPGNRRNVSRVEVRVATQGLLDGVRFVDTPGTGSVHLENTRAAMQWLPRVGAGLVAVSVAQPLAEDDLALLRELEPYTPEIILLLTKADLVDPAQLRNIEAFVHAQLRRGLGRDLPVAAVSVRPGHEESLHALRQLLSRRFGSDEKRRAADILAHKIETLRTACCDYLQLALDAARDEARARADLLRSIEQEETHLALFKRELALLARDAEERARAATESRFLAHKRNLADEMRRDLDRRLPQWRGRLDEECSEFRRWQGRPCSCDWRAQSRQRRRMGKGPTRREDREPDRPGFQDRVSGDVEAVLHRKVLGATFEAHPAAPGMSISLVGSSTHPGRPSGMLIPMRFVRPLVHRSFRRAVAWEVEKHLYRLASQWTESISASVRALVEAAGQFVERELETLKTLLESASQESSTDIAETLERLRAMEGMR
ncbi:dynamin family protein [bacterium]|nr:dynamin family protein [bacterium]